jgi:hypothetical protein
MNADWVGEIEAGTLGDSSRFPQIGNPYLRSVAEKEVEPVMDVDGR